MKARILIAASAFALALSACSQEAEETATVPESAESENGPELAGEEPGFEAVAPGTYEVQQANGDVDQMTIHPGMTWSRVAADGSASGGTIFMQGGETCFVTEGVEGHTCFTDGPVQEDGSMETTAEDGTVAVVRPAPEDTPAI